MIRENVNGVKYVAPKLGTREYIVSEDCVEYHLDTFRISDIHSKKDNTSKKVKLTITIEEYDD